MKTLVLLCLSVAVALALPVVHPGEEQKSMEEKQSPLLGDRLPEQGHVVVENPAPQAVLSFEKQDKVAPVEMKQSEGTAELKVEVKEEQEQKAEAEVKEEEEVKEVKPQQEVLVEAEAKMDTELQAETEFKVDAEVKKEVRIEKEEDEEKPEVKEEEEFAAENEVELEPEVPAEVETKEMEPELRDEPDLKVESQVKVEPDVQMELELEEEEVHPDQVIEERHIDMEGKYEAMGEPHMELEPLDDDDDDSVFEDEAKQETFLRQSPAAEALAEEEEEEEEFKDDGLNEDTIMELDPEMVEEPLQPEDVVPDAGDLDEEAALDMAGQQMSLSENYFPEEEAGMEMMSEKQDDLAEEEEYMMMLEEAMRQATSEKRSPAESLEEEGMEEGPQTDVMTFMREGQDNQEGGHCPGVLLGEKCYQFFKDPKKAADAEFFCQEHFPNGHLASITSEHSHRELMNLIMRENGHYTRTWVGGIKYLDTKRFVWLDGSHWSYADWLSGEPNDTSAVEDCLEVLALGNGKFNDFTCWEPQPFICSYTYQ